MLGAAQRVTSSFLNAYSTAWAKNLRLYPNLCLGFTREGLMCLEAVPRGDACPPHEPAVCVAERCKRPPARASHFCSGCLKKTRLAEEVRP